MRLRHKLVLDYYVGGVLHTLLKPIVCLLGLVLRRNHSLDRVRNICFVKILGGGSLVVAYPALLALKRSQRYRLQLLTSHSSASFANAMGVFDEVITIDDRKWWPLLRTTVVALKRLFRHDALVDLEIHSRLSVLFSLGACAVNRIGFYSASSYWRRGLSTHLLFFNGSTGIYHFYDQIAELFGAAIPPFGECQEAFRQHLGMSSRRRSTASGGVFKIGIAHGCSDLGVERMLRVDQWVSILAAAIRAQGQRAVHVHFIGGARDRATGDQIVAGLTRELSESSGLAFTNQCGQLALRDSILLLEEMDRLYCIDSGLMHFARLLGVPTESYWGPTSPVTRLRGVSPELDTVHYTAMACSPCVHVANVAPCKGNNVCMKMHTDPSLRPQQNRSWIAYGAGQ